jgi:hypothetical protein
MEGEGTADMVCRAANEPFIYPLDRFASPPHPTIYTRENNLKEIELSDGWVAGALLARDGGGEGKEGGLPGVPWCSDTFLERQMEGKENRDASSNIHMEQHPVPSLTLCALAQCLTQNSVGWEPEVGKGEVSTSTEGLGELIGSETRHFLLAIPHNWEPVIGW